MTAATRRLGLVRKIGSSFSALAGLASLLVWLGGARGAKVGPGEVQVVRPSVVDRDLAMVVRRSVEETIAAVGSVQPRRKAGIASQIIASVLEVLRTDATRL